MAELLAANERCASVEFAISQPPVSMTIQDNNSPFAALPAVDRVLSAAAVAELNAAYGRQAVADAVRQAINDLRQAIRRGEPVDVSTATVIAMAEHSLTAQAQPSLRPVFNLTGTVLHTNLGRAALPPEAIDAITTVAAGASNLEYDLDTGRRGERDSHVESQIAEITGTEAATVVNNNAAAVLLVLNTLGFGKGVAVSRGELVEIGGSFRIPDIMARSGARLVEVGTTNRTHLKDFSNALASGDARMIMKVHTSNYVIEGFTNTVEERALATLARDHGVPFINDLGSGTLVDLERFGLPHEPTPMEALKHGADVVTFSGDKLLGGPQAGIIVGRRDLIGQIRANPMKRALRCDKMTIAALATVLNLYRDPDRLAGRLPTLHWLTRSLANISAMVDDLLPALQRAAGDRAVVAKIHCESQIGSGALPTRTVASAGIAVRPTAKAAGDGAWPERIAGAFRRLPVPVIGRIHDGSLIFDLRCLDDAAGFRQQLDQLDLSE